MAYSGTGAKNETRRFGVPKVIAHSGIPKPARLKRCTRALPKGSYENALPRNRGRRNRKPCPLLLRLVDPGPLVANTVELQAEVETEELGCLSTRVE